MTPKEWRESQNLTQEALADKIGLTKGYISLLENGDRKPSFDVLKAYEEHSDGQVTINSFPATQ